jgi:exodeoxyribonuclease-5
MTAPALTPHQRDALRALLQLLDMESVVALRGLAGTGKTTLISHIANAVPNPTIAAMTHKAAAILRAKGNEGATTLQAACQMKPIFDNAYLELLTWFTAPDAPYPKLLRHLNRDRARAVVAEHLSEVGPDGCSRALGVDPAKQIIGWQRRTHIGGTLILDEASMATVDDVKEALDTFDRIVLVGDHGQLPPPKGVPALDIAEGVELTEIHRQAWNSPVLRLAHDIRNGVPLWKTGTPIARGPDPDAGPIIVWINKSRVELSLAMRNREGISTNRLEPGEPLICRATDKEHRRRGFFNNSPCVYLGDGWVQGEKGRRLQAKKLHVEELDKRAPRPDEVPFRLGYALTAHSAQGSEWPRVQVYYDDVRAMQSKGAEFRAKWLYTAITRAKESVRFFTAPIARTRTAA